MLLLGSEIVARFSFNVNKEVQPKVAHIIPQSVEARFYFSLTRHFR